MSGEKTCLDYNNDRKKETEKSIDRDIFFHVQLAGNLKLSARCLRHAVSMNLFMVT